tara:strand:- start:3188 stop:4114 length:927 start_codon:yes stop_codon:yes gene_type:complete
MKIVVTGGTGMVGNGFRNLETEHELIFVGSKDYDLRQLLDTQRMVEDHRPETIIHLAAKVGGVKGNSDFVADFFSDNIRINTNVLSVAHKLGVKKVVSLLSTCVYPDTATYPLTEEQIHSGEPHPSNFGYAYAKRMLDVHSRALRQQYGCNFICAVPNNLYGPCDNFDLENGHVIPSIIRKVWEAKRTGSSPVLWGDGSPLREFTYSRDIAIALLFLLENYDSPAPVNIGMTNEVSIKDIVEMICESLEYDGEIIWDITKPSGQFKKPSSNQHFLSFGWPNTAYTPLSEGIQLTCEWFKENYPNVRGV